LNNSIQHLPQGQTSANIRRSDLYIGNEKQRLRKAAEAFEAIMLQQLLKSAQPKNSRALFGGGMGEEFFQDHLSQERAKIMSERGGIGLADMLEKELLGQLELKASAPQSDKINKAAAQGLALRAYDDPNQSR
jgi:Rod binding domain-containing protein